MHNKSDARQNRLALLTIILSLIAFYGTLSPADAKTRNNERLGEATTRVITREGAFVNAIIVEGAHNLIVFDPGSSKSDADKIVSLSQDLKKPIAAVFVTHGHIDHYGAVGALRGDGRPFITGVGVARQIEEFDAINFARFGATPPAGNRAPDKILGHGESIIIDGVKVTLFDLGPGESFDDVWYLVETKNQREAIIGDIAMYGIPPFMQSGHSKDWLQSIASLKAVIPDDATIYIGHDLRAMQTGDAKRDKSILDWQEERILEFRDAVGSVTDRRRLLTDEEIAGVAKTLNEKAPDNLAAFNFLITTTANVLAAELILEEQKAMFETKLQAVFRNR